MPKIKPPKGYKNLKKEIFRLRGKVAKVLGVKRSELWSDTKRDENYGLLEGKVYCFDLHVLDFNKLLKNGQKYRTMPWL